MEVKRPKRVVIFILSFILYCSSRADRQFSEIKHPIPTRIPHLTNPPCSPSKHGVPLLLVPEHGHGLLVGRVAGGVGPGEGSRGRAEGHRQAAVAGVEAG